MSLFRVWQITQFELTRIFATKRGLLALTAFAMVWFMIFKYLIAEAVPFLSDPIFQDIARQLAGSIGFQELISWPEAEFAIYWVISLYCFPLFSLFVGSDQTVGDRQRGTLRFLSLRSTRNEILLGRYLGQLLIIAILITATVLATLIIMSYRDSSLLSSGLLLGLKLSLQLTLISMPFIALMSFLNIVTSSSRLSIVMAILLFTLGSAVIAYFAHYTPFIDVLFYAFPGEQITDVAGQKNTSIIDWLIPVVQSVGWLLISIVALRKRAL